MENGNQALRSNARMALDILRRSIDDESATPATTYRNDTLLILRGRLSGISLMLVGNGGMSDLIAEIESLTGEISVMQDENYWAMRATIRTNVSSRC